MGSWSPSGSSLHLFFFFLIRNQQKERKSESEIILATEGLVGSSSLVIVITVLELKTSRAFLGLDGDFETVSAREKMTMRKQKRKR